jgi:hypothetical protein
MTKANGSQEAVSYQVMALAERQGKTTPLMVGHRLIGMSALHTADMGGAGMKWQASSGKS